MSNSGETLEASGLLDEALTAYVSQHDWEGAVRVSLGLNRQLDAAKYCLAANRPYDAAVCFQRAGELRDCLLALLEVPSDAPRFRSACVHVVRVAQVLSVPLEQHATFFLPFLAAVPGSQVEADAMKAIAHRLAVTGRGALAASVLRTVLSVFPADADAHARLLAIAGSDDDGRRIMRPSGVTPPPLFPTSLTPTPFSEHQPARRPRMLDLLLHRGALTREALDGLVRAQPHLEQHDVALAEALVATGLATEAATLRALADAAGAGFFVERELLDNLSREAAKVLTWEYAEKWGVVPVRVVGGELHVAMADARDRGLLERLRFSVGLKVVGFFATRGAITRAQDKLYAAPLTTPAVGTTFAGRYRLEAVLGDGATATVFRALDLELGERVALKLFHPGAEADSLVARFKLELSLSRQLTHPNVVRLFDLGGEGTWRCLTMELLEGVDLLTRLERAGGKLPLVEGLRLLEQAALGLEAVHAQGVVHRDVKPQNLFVTTAGQVKVMDFGAACRVDTTPSPGDPIIGTPEYMSPEQLRGGRVGAASDLYSLGVTAYQVFTGRLPFAYDDPSRVLVAQVSEPPLPPRARNPFLPVALENLVLDLLQKDPARRPQSAAAVASALRALAAS